MPLMCCQEQALPGPRALNDWSITGLQPHVVEQLAETRRLWPEAIQRTESPALTQRSKRPT
jgi:hypothetical protein